MSRYQNVPGYYRYGVPIAIVLFLIIIGLVHVSRTIEAGHVAVVTEFGKVTNRVLSPGLSFILPWQMVYDYNCKVSKYEGTGECFSKDLQVIDVSLTMLSSLQAKNIRDIHTAIGRNYMSQSVPRIWETLKQSIAKYNAEEVIEKREQIRQEVLAICRERLSDVLEVHDIVLANISFSDVYEQAIERKQVAQQEALKAKYELERAKTEAEKQIEIARGEAEAIRIRGEALEKNPGVIQLEAIGKWDGKSPSTVVLGSDADVPVVFPIK